MAQVSAGILMHRGAGENLQVLLVHPGGPFWRNRDRGAWSIPKGEVEADEDLEAAARREFAEELGFEPIGELQPLGRVQQTNGKVVEAFALEGDFDPACVCSNSFQIEWPPHSGIWSTFPEVDRANWFTLRTAREKIVRGQKPLLDRLRGYVRS